MKSRKKCKRKKNFTRNIATEQNRYEKVKIRFEWGPYASKYEPGKKIGKFQKPIINWFGMNLQCTHTVCDTQDNKIFRKFNI